MEIVNGTAPPVNVVVVGITLSVLVVAFLVIVGGNLLTLLAIWRTESLRTIPNMYVTSLAISDLSTGVLIIGHALLLKEISELHYNKLFCLTMILIIVSLTRVSGLMMVLIALDRYLYIKFPLHYAIIINTDKTKIAIVTAWIIAVTSSLYVFFVNNWDDSVGCVYLTVPPAMMRAAHLMFFFITENGFSIFFYGSILHIAWRQQRVVASGTRPCGPTITTNRWKIIKLFLVVYGMFFICLTPYYIFYILYAFISTPLAVSYVVVPLMYVNAGANCFVYGWHNKDFRRAYKEIFRCGYNL